jgi:hypothetical protein
MTQPWSQPTTEDIYEGAIRIRDEVASGEPFCIGRNGTIEMEVLYYFLTMRAGSGERMDYPPRLVEQIGRNAGIFPITSESIDRWAATYLAALGQMRGMAAGWYKPMWHVENTILNQFAQPTLFRTPLRSLEPYYVPEDLRWTSKLSGRRVAVVSSFTDSIRHQLFGELKGAIWSGEREGLLPTNVEWSFHRTGYSPTLALGHGGWPSGITTWEQAVDYIVKGVVKSGAEVALIGCGGLGMIIAADLRKKGISAIVLGGAIQVLFGIRGKRWATHDVISKFWNNAWIWPCADEIPGGANMVEGACYWRPET